MATAAVFHSPTPSQSLRSDKLDTPVGDRDRAPKVQLCLEIRNKEVTKSKTKKTQQVLEVTVIYVKHLPNAGQNQLVKLRLHHKLRDEIVSTEVIKPGTTDGSRYIEIFSFPIDNNYLEGTTLLIQVCDKKATRNTKCYGEVQLNLHHLQPNEPICEWYKLETPEVA